jgi:uncharacterized circularly permuted ATP-grasp superfamily protein
VAGPHPGRPDSPEAGRGRARVHRVGITFAVYGEESGSERLIPFDIVPRIISGDEWKVLDRGLRQRVQALNAFLHDVYHDQAILKAGVVPARARARNANTAR